MIFSVLPDYVPVPNVIEDPLFRVSVAARTPAPNTLVWKALHQCYSELAVADEEPPAEGRAGKIAVKRLLANDRGHFGCYSEDTEVLTSEGWVAWPLITSNHQLAAVDPETGATAFERPSALQQHQLTPEHSLLEVQSQKIDYAVTLDHRMIVSSRINNGGWSTWRVESAADIIGRSVRFRTGGVLQERRVPSHCPTNVDLIQLFKIAGFFYGDGIREQAKKPSYLRFRLIKLRKIKFLRSCGFNVDVMAGDRYVVRNREVAHWVHAHFATVTGKAIPSFILELPKELFEAFAEGLRNSDGTPKGKTWSFDSKEKAALDMLQAAFVLNNTPAHLGLNNPNVGPGCENHAPVWRLHVSCREPVVRCELNQVGRTVGTQKLVPYTGKVYCATVSTGALFVRRNNKVMICGNCLEHPQITFATSGFPHSVMQQARTHRVGISFDVQSSRYSGERMMRLSTPEGAGGYGRSVPEHLALEIEELIYFRPLGPYRDRQGDPYEYTLGMLTADKVQARYAVEHYILNRTQHGMAEEHARSYLPFDIRQNFVVSFNLRSLLHFLTVRGKKDAQPEIQQLCIQMLPHLHAWSPEFYAWFMQHQWQKGRLAP